MALAPFFWLVTAHIARNQSVSGLRVYPVTASPLSPSSGARNQRIAPEPPAPANSSARHIVDTKNHPANAALPDTPGRLPLSRSGPQIRPYSAGSPPRTAYYILGLPESSRYPILDFLTI